MHAYFQTSDKQVLAIRLSGVSASTLAAATKNMTRIAAPAGAKAKRVCRSIRTCRIINGQIGSI